MVLQQGFPDGVIIKTSGPSIVEGNTTFVSCRFFDFLNPYIAFTDMLLFDRDCAQKTG